jgi:hypothetical protein
MLVGRPMRGDWLTAKGLRSAWAATRAPIEKKDRTEMNRVLISAGNKLFTPSRLPAWSQHKRVYVFPFGLTVLTPTRGAAKIKN